MSYRNVLYPYTTSNHIEVVADMQADMNIQLRKGKRVHSVLDLGYAFLVIYEPNVF